MNSDEKENDFPATTKGAVIMLAWPETRVSRTGAWYDPISKALGWIKNDTYKVGHAAFCLIDYNKKKAFYYDFGRYQAPLGFGRVRSAHTDPELIISIEPIIESGIVKNLNEILIDIKNNSSTHGDGYLIGAARQDVNIGPVYNYILSLQDKDHVSYAPFKPASTNCSRFASSAFLKSGFENSFSKFLNVISLFQFNFPLKQITQKSHRNFLHIVDDSGKYFKLTRNDFKIRKSQFKMDEKPSSKYLHKFDKQEYHELKGLGAHAYYKIVSKNNGQYLISRYDDHNIKHFEFLYELKKGTFNLSLPFTLTYPSHARVVSILQNDKFIRLERV